MKIVNRETAKRITSPHGTQITPLIDRSTSEITRSSLPEEIMPPGKALKPHYHKTHVEVYYLISGARRKRVADEWKEVQAGDAMYITGNWVHSLENTGQED